MASSLQKFILIALVLSIEISISFGHTEDSDDESKSGNDSEPDTDNRDASYEDSEIGRYLKDLCSNTKNSKQCWRIIKSVKDRFTDTNSSNVARVVIDLATEKSKKIQHQLNHLHGDTGDDKYRLCAFNYKVAKEDLEMAKRHLDPDEYRRIHVLINDAVNELKSCKHQFGKSSPDPAHVRDRNKEFGYFVDIVKVATNPLSKGKDDDSDRKN